jgi:hypothetical protein
MPMQRASQNGKRSIANDVTHAVLMNIEGSMAVKWNGNDNDIVTGLDPQNGEYSGNSRDLNDVYN